MKRSNEAIMTDLDALKEFLGEPRTMRDMVRHFGRDRKTVFRWLKALEARGVVVTRIGLNRPTRYFAFEDGAGSSGSWSDLLARASGA